NWLRDNRELPADLNEDLYQSTDSGPEELYLEKERARELSRVLQELPPIYREVILLKHVGELSYTEICETLDLGITLVKNRLYRGRIMLREALEKGGYC
ncbi:MAG: sigma-70 family RNA polymerase sigma factor, partial [Clostridia bacterium]|nr:sigma-70 family RNA polymerase sigma factor [Clostridia bacterium]